MNNLFGQKVMNGARVQKDLKDLVLVAACGACVFSCFWVPENSVQLRENSFLPGQGDGFSKIFGCFNPKYSFGGKIFTLTSMCWISMGWFNHH